MRFQRSIASILLCALLTGCVHYHPHASRSAPAVPPQEIASRFSYPAGSVEPQIKILETKRKYTLKQVSFDLHLPADLIQRPVEEMRKEVEEKRKNNDEKGAHDLELEYTVIIDLYLSNKEGKRPLIIVSPILGGNMVVDWFAKYFAKKGFNAAIVHRRKPRYDSSQPLSQTEESLRKSVIRTRQALDWLIAQPEMDADRVGSFGISYGGIVNTLMAGVEPRVKYHIVAMAGGPVSDLILDSEEKAIKKYVRTAMNDAGYTYDKLKVDLKDSIKSDTLTLAEYIDTKEVLFVIALFDRVVHRRYARGLWKAMGKPEVIYTPFGHYGTILATPYLRYRAVKFYKKKFYPRKKILWIF